MSGYPRFSLALTALAASDTMVSVIRCTPPFLGTAVTIRARATWRFLEIENTPGPLAARRSQCIPARSIAISSTHYVILYINKQADIRTYSYYQHHWNLRFLLLHHDTREASSWCPQSLPGHRLLMAYLSAWGCCGLLLSLVPAYHTYITMFSHWQQSYVKL